MTTLPGYDAWKLASPLDHPDEFACTCGHSQDEHLHPVEGRDYFYFGECLECDGECADYTPAATPCEGCGDLTCTCDMAFERRGDR